MSYFQYSDHHKGAQNAFARKLIQQGYTVAMYRERLSHRLSGYEYTVLWCDPKKGDFLPLARPTA